MAQSQDCGPHNLDRELMMNMKGCNDYNFYKVVEDNMICMEGKKVHGQSQMIAQVGSLFQVLIKELFKLFVKVNIKIIKNMVNGVLNSKEKLCIQQYADKIIRGGGFYNLEGMKEGNWVDLRDRFSRYNNTIYQGEYKQGRRSGKWTIVQIEETKYDGETFQNRIQMQETKIKISGGGYFDNHGLKQMGRIEQRLLFRQASYIHWSILKRYKKRYLEYSVEGEFFVPFKLVQ
ncbi:unnamed protein product (macronuclear) [Paramecium tetraurelia]|uniref:Uncharacterized protein n=1 Tax=Paramecium tetraurelia TaxID=5888 RepID=A0CLQ8_PARTE|nr:uncharacterized protein GSPATT00038650001 [Paramecium tetraurelia]CAK71725.1 unnamed protein product [Paramecium tetraurelia]|eukprot:XP_001439122.1 hypothetical protein (macronuclear) [Paramecium tetraurelia strain d4-2]